MIDASQLISHIEREFHELRKEYILYLSNRIKLEPLDQRLNLLKKLKRLQNMTNMRTEDHFRTDNLVAKVQSHCQLWDRQVEEKLGSGSRHRKTKKKEEKELDVFAPRKAEPGRQPDRKVVTITDAAYQRERVVELFDEYTRLSLLSGGRNLPNFGKFQSFIANQTQKLQKAKHAKSVQYEVVLKDQKVIIKSKSLQ